MTASKLSTSVRFHVAFPSKVRSSNGLHAGKLNLWSVACSAVSPLHHLRVHRRAGHHGLRCSRCTASTRRCSTDRSSWRSARSATRRPSSSGAATLAWSPRRPCSSTCPTCARTRATRPGCTTSADLISGQPALFTGRMSTSVYAGWRVQHPVLLPLGAAERAVAVPSEVG